MTRNCQVNELLWIPRTGVLTRERSFEHESMQCQWHCYWTPIKATIFEICLSHFRITLNQHIILQLNLMYCQTAVRRELVGNTDVTSDLRVVIGQLSLGNPRLTPAKNQPTEPNHIVQLSLLHKYAMSCKKNGFETKKRKHWRNISGLYIVWVWGIPGPLLPSDGN